MLINIADQVVIFDEAHNMEDSARDAASSSVTCPQLEEVLYEMGELCKYILYTCPSMLLHYPPACLYQRNGLCFKLVPNVVLICVQTSVLYTHTAFILVCVMYFCADLFSSGILWGARRS